MTRIDHAAALVPLTTPERRAVTGLAAIFATRMLGLFMILPVFALYADELPGATPLLVGFAIGAYGLTQALLQVPLGLLSDRFGRKPVILAGLALFAFGSLVAGLAGDIYWIIAGRILQGAGAIAAAVIALTADLTREQVRTRGMAVIGISVALSFAAALVLGPPLARWSGLSGIFLLTAVLALLGMVLLVWLVPDPARSLVHRDSQLVPRQLAGVLRNATLLRLDGAIFLLHLTMVSLFVVLPLSLETAGLARADHWLLYLPVVLLAIVVMVPFIILAEKGGQARLVLLVSVALLGLALFGFHLLDGSLWGFGTLLVAVFTIFNVLEAVLPALVSKESRAGTLGTAMGVFSSAQFIGAFLGGLLGGWAHGTYGPDAVYLLGSGLTLIWLALLATLRMPGDLRRQVLPLITPLQAAPEELVRRLLAVPGVAEALVDAESGLAYLKVDSRRLDSATLKTFSADA